MSTKTQIYQAKAWHYLPLAVFSYNSEIHHSQRVWDLQHMFFYSQVTQAMKFLLASALPFWCKPVSKAEVALGKQDIVSGF